MIMTLVVLVAVLIILTAGGFAMLEHKINKVEERLNTKIDKEVSMMHKMGPTGPMGMMGKTGPPGISKRELDRLHTWISVISLRARDMIDNEENTRLGEMIFSPDTENLIVAEEAIKQLNKNGSTDNNNNS